MSEPSNEDRANLAQETMHYFTKEAPGHTHYCMTDIIDESDIGDLITNLQHMCARDGLDWARALSMGDSNYEYERNENGDDV